jgi:hypothetical protein
MTGSWGEYEHCWLDIGAERISNAVLVIVIEEDQCWGAEIKKR